MLPAQTMPHAAQETDEETLVAQITRLRTRFAPPTTIPSSSAPEGQEGHSDQGRREQRHRPQLSLVEALGPVCARCQDTGYYTARGVAGGAEGLYTLLCGCGYWPAYYQRHAHLDAYAGCTLDNYHWERLADDRVHVLRHRGKLPPVVADLARGYAHDTAAFLRAYQDNLLAHLQEGRGLYLWGSYGSGKSHLMCALLNRACRLGVAAERLNESEYLTKLKDSFNEDGPDAERTGAIFRHYAEVDLLGLDEFCGSGHKDGRDGWAAREISDLLDARYRAHKTTLFTANYAPAALDAEFRTGVLSRIRGTCLVLEVIAADYRAEVQAVTLRDAARRAITPASVPVSPEPAPGAEDTGAAPSL